MADKSAEELRKQV